MDAPWAALGTLTSGALWELWGRISELSGTILETFWDDFRALFLSLLRMLSKPELCFGRSLDVLVYIVREVRKIIGIVSTREFLMDL